MTQKQTNITLDPKQPVFIGLDVHKNKWAVAVIHQDENIAKFTIPGEFSALFKLLERYSHCPIKSVYEAGFLGFCLHYRLQEAGIDNIIVSPNKLPLQVGDLVKTDRRDAQKLAFSLSKGLITGIHIPDPKLLNIRSILRTREKTVNKKKRCINQIKSHLFQYNLKLPKNMGAANRIAIRNFELPQYIKFSIDQLLEEYDHHKNHINELNVLAKKEALESYPKEYSILQSIPGIGATIAASLCFEIGDWTRFKNAEKLSAYLGLTPREYSSGDKVYKGRITGQGKSWIRGYLVEACWKTISYDPAMRVHYDRIKINSGSGKKAIVAVARKLVHRMFSLIKYNKAYELNLAA